MITLDELKTLDDAAFNRAVCAMLGWTVVQTESGRWQRWELVTPDGTRTGHAYSITEKGAWEYLATHYAGDDYAGDLNAAWALWPDGVPIVLWRNAGDDETEAISIDSHEFSWQRIRDKKEKAHVSPARALATAWYVWELAERGGAG